jgi:spermidine/putrescine-binding protein
MNTQLRRILFAAGLITAALTGSAFAQQDEKLGKLSFSTSCDPKVQAEFERGVAMIHSYWFLMARRTF